MRLLHIDAFTSRPFSGNPAVVALLDGEAPVDWMQAVAAEMNVSETAFVWREFQDLRLRWFTPRTEVALCGHGTLAAAHAVREENWLRGPGSVRFQTASGVLGAEFEAGGIRLEFPLVPVTPTQVPNGLAEALRTDVGEVWRGGEDLLVPLPDRERVEACRPDFERLAAIPARGVVVTARGHGMIDFVSRFFAPRIGVPEDPVTGSTHCALAAYWSPRLKQRDLLGWQASARGGQVRVRLRADKVHLIGTAVTVATGTLVAAPELPPAPFDPAHRREVSGTPAHVRTRRPRLLPRQPPTP